MSSVSVLYYAHLWAKCSLDISNFPEEISSLPHSIVFLYFFALIIEEGFLISSCSSLELCIQMLISFLFSLAFCFSSFTAIWKASSDSHFAFLHFFSTGMVLIPVSCTMSHWKAGRGALGFTSIWPFSSQDNSMRGALLLLSIYKRK